MKATTCSFDVNPAAFAAAAIAFAGMTTQHIIQRDNETKDHKQNVLNRKQNRDQQPLAAIVAVGSCLGSCVGPLDNSRIHPQGFVNAATAATTGAAK